MSDAAEITVESVALRPELEEQLAHVRALLHRELAAAPGIEDACLTCSFQAEDVLLLHLVQAIRPRIPVLFLDTGYHFAETYAYRDRMASAWNLNLINLLPKATVAQQEAEHGLLYQSAPDRCCGLRKVEPLFTAVANYKVWLTGLRREQARSRAALEEAADFTLPGGVTVRKLSPFADWTTRDVWQLATRCGIPLLPLLRSRLHLDRLRTMYLAADRPERSPFGTVGRPLRTKGGVRHSYPGRACPVNT